MNRDYKFDSLEFFHEVIIILEYQAPRMEGWLMEYLNKHFLYSNLISTNILQYQNAKASKKKRERKRERDKKKRK